MHEDNVTIFLSLMLKILEQFLSWVRYLNPMRPKAIEGWPNMAARLAGWRRVAQQMWFCMWWTGRTAYLFRTVLVALTGAAKLRAQGISSCCYIVNVHNHPSWAMSRKEGMAWYSSRPMPSLYLKQPHPIPLSPRPTSFFSCTKSQDSAIRNKSNKILSKYLCLISVGPGGSMRRCSRNRTTKFTTRLGFPSPTYEI